jgi:hypothetical protein
MSTLRQRLNDLASSFASSVLEAIRSASLEELLAESSSSRRAPVARAGRASIEAAAVTPSVAHAPRGRAGGRLARRSSDDIEQVIGRIVGLLKQNPKGLRAEEIRSKLGLLSKEMPRPLKEALDSGRLGKSGQKRATTYFVKSAGAGAPAKAGKKAGRPRKSRS